MKEQREFTDKMWRQQEILEMDYKAKNLSEALEQFEGDAKKAKDHVEEHLQKNPWVTLGLVGVVCFVLGLIFGRGRSRRSE